MASARIGRKVHYRESDGKPMAETKFHRDVMMDLIVGLQDWFAAGPLAYVSGNEFLYFVEGDPRRVVSPDVWVALGIDGAGQGRSFKTWEQGGKGPDLVVEVSSKSTRREDLGKKFALYRDDLKVREYFLFDPLGEYLKPPLKGYRLVGAEYQPIEPEDGRLPSQVLRLHLEADGRVIRLFDPATRQRLLTRPEQIEAEKAANREKDSEIREKDALLRQAEAEAERLRRMIEELRAEAGSKPKPRPKKKRT